MCPPLFTLSTLSSHNMRGNAIFMMVNPLVTEMESPGTNLATSNLNLTEACRLYFILK